MVVSRTVGRCVSTSLKISMAALSLDGCRGLLVTQNVSKSVECEVGETAELVQEEFGAVVAGGEQGAGEGGVFLGPEVDG